MPCISVYLRLIVIPFTPASQCVCQCCSMYGMCLFIWQASVAEWLQQLGLSQYETVMIESGYDAIDFITSVDEEELVEIGITKKGFFFFVVASFTV